ncbi:hypothetical protein ATN84_02815 [Paramesorhizobium deserti]|uniref:Uncharacterized protein n=1 Tax=Paramesorhizobium deserti TaxID=1494590 RepID=A0A135HZT6_9HYPH|nr:hypothetical protein ATN84_02815 [Paramesorhizobium deserti]
MLRYRLANWSLPHDAEFSGAPEMRRHLSRFYRQVAVGTIWQISGSVTPPDGSLSAEMGKIVAQ